MIGLVPVTRQLGPTDVPDQAVATLDHQLLMHHQIPNLEYGFSFRSSQSDDLATIQYQTIFKELISPPADPSSAESKKFKMVDLAGRYLCINFKWSTAKYLAYLRQLLTVRSDYSGPIFEESFPLSYYQNEFARGQQAITELRIKLD
ncbi:hypothetical protein [Limosilactobacillus difficilis]|uniref:hypothetical protein n=1 Tax=Limosilactobacillus difficilis TaxID=2991838 RepID=UPI0024BA0B98|nr:hypothetical protein [Limosilactobacillus difficilis]